MFVIEVAVVNMNLKHIFQSSIFTALDGYISLLDSRV